MQSKEISKRVQRERKKTDRSLLAERKKVDDAIIKENKGKVQGEKQLAEASAIAEDRKDTDTDLARERLKADSGIQNMDQILDKEIAAHFDTKTSLTSRDEFLAIVSHDLRNPIGTIVSCADLLLEDSSPNKMQPELKKWIELMKRNADTALALISDLLDMERISSNKLIMSYADHNLVDLLQQSLENFARAAQAKSLHLQMTSSEESIVMRCDSHRILQVLSNLIGNAIKFTAPGGKITLALHKRGEWDIEVTVRDTGPGIPLDQQESLFQRFSQLGRSDRQGLGLGLYIAKKIIDAHSGHLWVKSIVGVGSTFGFTLPQSGKAQ